MKFIYTFFLLAFINYSYSQYDHQFELNAGVGMARIDDEKVVRIGNTLLPHTLKLNGLGWNISLSYKLNEIPVLLTLNTSSYNLRNPGYNPQILTLPKPTRLDLRSGDFSIEWIFFNKYAFNPYVSAGVALTYFNMSRNFERYSFTPANDPEFITVEEIRWEYEDLSARFSNYGFFNAVGARFKLSDRFGLNGSVRFFYYPDHELITLNDPKFILTFSAGAYFKLFKRRNYLL